MSGFIFYYVMAIKAESLSRFKLSISRLVVKGPDYRKEADFNYVILDIGNEKDRIMFPGYSSYVKAGLGCALPYLGSPVRVVVEVKASRRHGVSHLERKDLQKKGK